MTSEPPETGVDPATGEASDPAGEPDDRTLLLAHRDGDPTAFGVLFARHRDRLWAVALRTTGHPEDAADALQEAMISAFRRADSFRGDAAVTTWLHRIVVNASLDRLRRAKVRSADALPDDLEERATRGAVLADQGSRVDPAEQVELVERRRRVLAALEQLPPDQKVALVLVDLEGYPVQEAAEVLEVPTGTVKSRCARGRTRLAALLSDLREENPSGKATIATTTAGAAPGGTGRDVAASHSGDQPHDVVPGSDRGGRRGADTLGQRPTGGPLHAVPPPGGQQGATQDSTQSSTQSRDREPGPRSVPTRPRGGEQA